MICDNCKSNTVVNVMHFEKDKYQKYQECKKCHKRSKQVNMTFDEIMNELTQRGKNEQEKNRSN